MQLVLWGRIFEGIFDMDWVVFHNECVVAYVETRNASEVARVKKDCKIVHDNLNKMYCTKFCNLSAIK